MTSYANLGGTGDRQSLIDVRVTVDEPPSIYTFSAPSLVDGNTGGGVNLAQVVTVQFNFHGLGSVIIDEITLYKEAGKSAGTYRVEGSNNGSSWQTLLESIELGADASYVIPFTNFIAYQYYRFVRVTPGLIPVRWSEAEFKIALEDYEPAAPPEPAPEPTSYDNLGGMGDRRFIIDIVSDLVLTSGNLTNVINGNYDSNLFGGIQITTTTDVGQHITFDLDCIGPQIISELRINRENAAQSFGTWICEASNDGDYWDQLGESFEIGSFVSEVIVPLNNAVFYRYYRLVHVAGNINDGTQRWLNEIEFKISGHDHNTIASNTDYANLGGVGDRRAIITVTANFTPSFESIDKLIDGGKDGGFPFDWIQYGSTELGQEIKFDFGATPRVIDEVKFYRSTDIETWGVWRFLGSNDDINYTELRAAMMLHGAFDITNLIQSAGVRNSTAYRYYKLEHIRYELRDTHNEYEIEFKIGDEIQVLEPETIANSQSFGTLTVNLEGGLFQETVTNASTFGSPAIVQGQKPYVVSTIILT